MLLKIDSYVAPGGVGTAIVLNQIQLPTIHFHIKANRIDYKLSHGALKSFFLFAILVDLYGSLTINF